MHCANGCMKDITAEQSSSVMLRDLGNGVCIYEHRHLDCTTAIMRLTAPPITAE